MQQMPQTKPFYCEVPNKGERNKQICPNSGRGGYRQSLSDTNFSNKFRLFTASDCTTIVRQLYLLQVNTGAQCDVIPLNLYKKLQMTGT